MILQLCVFVLMPANEITIRQQEVKLEVLTAVLLSSKEVKVISQK